jgi:hypothetical protein
MRFHAAVGVMQERSPEATGFVIGMGGKAEQARHLLL